MTTRSHFMEQGRSVFIKWDPQEKESIHRIATLKSGDFEVTCHHRVLDETTIRSQIKYKLAQEKDL